MNTEHATPELFAALALAQGEVENASKNSNNPHFRSKYADLAEVLNTVRPVFAKHGLSILQTPSYNGQLASVTTVVAHKGGGYVVGTASCVPAKSDAQGIGSATTYLRRYSLAAMAGVAQEDDDGNAAAHNKKPEPVAAGRPTDGAWEAMDADQQAGLTKLSAEIVDFGEDYASAYAHILAQKLDSDETTALWTLLGSKTRSGLKKAALAAKESGK